MQAQANTMNNNSPFMLRPPTPPLHEEEYPSQMELERQRINEQLHFIQEMEQHWIQSEHEGSRKLNELLNSPFTPGEFHYIEDDHSRKLIKNGYHAVRLTETANFVKQDIDSFQWSQDPRIWIISNKMDEIEDPPGHSGFTFGWTMREVQKIFRLGEEEYRRNWIIANNKKVQK
jgi:hypothetical protein